MITTKIINNKYYAAYNNQYVVLDSSNKTESRMKYITQIFEGGTSIELARLRTPPDRQGYGVVEIDNILKDYITYEMNYDVNISQGDNNNFYEYDLKFGEEYTFIWAATQSSDASGFIKLTSTDNHIFSVGDLLDVDSDNQTEVESGLWRVTATPTANEITINQTFLGTFSGIYNTRYADNRSTQFLDLTSGTTSYVYNAVNPFSDNSDWDFDEWELGTTNGKLISNIPEYLEINIDDYFTANYFAKSGDSLELIYTSPTMSTLTSIPSNHGTIGIGPENLKSIIAFNIGDEYNIKIRDIDTDKLTNILTFKIVERCSKFDNYKIIWLDRKGAWKTFNFENSSEKKIQVKKTEFKKENIGGYDSYSNTYIIDKEEFGDRLEKVDFTEVININSGLLTHYQILNIEDLFTSKYVFHIKDGVASPIILLTNTYNVVDLLKERSNTIDIDFKYSNKNNNN